MPKSGFAIIALLLILAIPVALFLSLSFIKSSSPTLTPLFTQKVKTKEILVEKIKGSKFHSPDATWWGYNQSKIVRFKNFIFTYFIDNDDDSNKTLSRLVVMKKDGDEPWEEGATFPTSRPGNLLIDSKGVLHAFVFEPYDVVKNDSWGRILHYWFPDASKGDIKNYKQETVVDNDDKSETANIRVGAAIGADDTIAISFGLTKFNPAYKEQSEHVYFKKSDEEKWNHTYTDRLPHDYFYPFTLVSGNTFYLLPIQDDFIAQDKPNIYQKILFMQVKNGDWQNEIIVDLSNHLLAKTKPRLLEQEDLYQDKDGTIHILYKEFLDNKNQFAPTVHWHVKGKLGNFKSEQIKLDKPGVNWVRLLEVEGKLYYLITTFGELFISKAYSSLISSIDQVKLTKLDIPEDAKNNYPYVSTKKAGSTDSNYADILLLGADKKLFEENQITNYYIRIPKEKFTSL